ncbi:hypothetical protein LF1_21840 [Rubripirellula obstinata]|uniref:Uncharacterized protein n=1 Tax=Rubripirellula obstinata TaxID=406547 RepID=A0A5B1CIV1_9BACT|nr:hypothetical protein LF1_21840 [Rubripirellula obstinata]
MTAIDKIVAILLVRTTRKRARASVDRRECVDHIQGYARLKGNVRKRGEKGTNLAPFNPQNSPFYLICLSDNVKGRRRRIDRRFAAGLGHFAQLSN